MRNLELALKYLAGDRIQGTAAERAAMSTSTVNVTQNSWKLVERFNPDGGGAGRTLTSSTFGAYDQLMVLAHLIPAAGSPESKVTIGNAGTYTSSGYDDVYYYDLASSSSPSGGAGTLSNTSNWTIGGSHDDTPRFHHLMIANNSTSNDRMAFARMAGEGDAVNDAGELPQQRDMALRCDGQTSQITNIKFDSGDDAKTFAATSEVVILGLNYNEGSSGSIWWEQLAEGDTTTGESGEIDSGTFTPKKYMMYEIFGVASGTSSVGDVNIKVGYGDDNSSTTMSSSGYANFCKRNGDNTELKKETSDHQSIIIDGGGDDLTNYTSGYLVNLDGSTKLSMQQSIENREDGTDYTKIVRNNGVWKWVDTDDKINRIVARSQQSSGGGWTTGSKIRVWGHD